MVGKTLNDTYVVERILGEGAMGRVYLARHTRIAQKQVAVKVLRPEYVRNADVLARFQREAETAASISHPNVVAVYDVDRTPRGLPYLVSEYLEGLDLGQHLKQQRKLTLPTALHIVRQLCEGLGAAHRCGVIHRDLKPHNIYLVGDFADGVPELPFIKILDFGLSKFMDAPSGQLVTETGIIMGTPAFMPPEQAMGQQADLRADIYGVGALLYTFLTGRLPFDEATPQATVLAVIGTEPPRPRAVAPSIPEYAELVIQRAMAKSPAARYPDMAALLEAIEPLLDEQHGRHPTSSSKPGPRAPVDTQIAQAKTARPQLVLFLNAALVLLFGSSALAVAGIEQAVGWSLTRLELGLTFACIVAVAITPGLLVAHRIRRRVWPNTNRVLELLSGVRSAVLTALATYGMAWFGFRVFDGVVLRLMGERMRANVAWAGWDFLLPLIGLGAGIVALWRERALSETLSGWRRGTVVVLATGATLGLAAFVIPVGMRWQAQPVAVPNASSGAAVVTGGEDSATAPQGAGAVSIAQPINTNAMAAPGLAEAAASGPAPEPAAAAAAVLPTTTQPQLGSDQTANDAEFRAGTAQGVRGLTPLAERYPNDARVLRALVMAHASHSAELGDAMVVVRRLFVVAPEEAKSSDLQYLVQRAAETPGVPAELAWKIMAEAMGSHGPDVLYGLTLTKPKLTERAEQLLGEPSVRQRTTPALAIAHELRTAPSCPARLLLLDRAIAEGDARSLAVLSGLSTGTYRGCGKNNRKPCKPACPEQADAFRSAIAKLSLRLKSGDK